MLEAHAQKVKRSVSITRVSVPCRLKTSINSVICESDGFSFRRLELPRRVVIRDIKLQSRPGLHVGSKCSGMYDIEGERQACFCVRLQYCNFIA